jgi:hypothetical protein
MLPAPQSKRILVRDGETVMVRSIRLKDHMAALLVDLPVMGALRVRSLDSGFRIRDEAREGWVFQRNQH